MSLVLCCISVARADTFGSLLPFAIEFVITRDQGNLSEVVYSTTDVNDAAGSFNFDDLGVGIFEMMVVATDSDSAEMLFDEDSFRRNEDVDAVFIGIGNGEINFLDLAV